MSTSEAMRPKSETLEDDILELKVRAIVALLLMVLNGAGLIALLSLGGTSGLMKLILSLPALATAIFAGLYLSRDQGVLAYVRTHWFGDAPARHETGLFDPETSTFGPLYLNPAYEHEMARARLAATPMTLMAVSLMYADVSEQYGIMAAEHVVRVVAQILRKSLRGSDVICYNEDGEFVILLVETAMASAECPKGRIMRAVDQWNLSSKARYRIDLVIGFGNCWEGLLPALEEARSTAVPIDWFCDLAAEKQQSGQAGRR